MKKLTNTFMKVNNKKSNNEREWKEEEEWDKKNYLINIKFIHDLPYFGSESPIEATCIIYFNNQIK
jgi:hypothetical protein